MMSSFDHLRCRPRKQCAAAASSPVAQGTVSRKSFSYSKLHQEPLNLTVLKLDSSSFRIEVRNGATVGELKAAVEDHFSIHPPHNLGPGKVSWEHVWRKFCISYGDQKLLVEKKSMRDLGIKDGDELHFARHVSRHPNTRSREDNLNSNVDKLSNNQPPHGYSSSSKLCDQKGARVETPTFCHKLTKALLQFYAKKPHCP